MSAPGPVDHAALAARVVEHWRRRHAAWDAELFARLGRGPTASLAARLNEAAERGSEKDDEAVVHAFLQLVAEALRLRYVGGAPNLLARCLLDVVPRRLAAQPPSQRLRLLADVWNLGEGLLRQPPWMGRLANTLLTDAEVDDLPRLGERLGATLAPLLSPPRRSSFTPPFTTQIVDLREVDEDFLPGPMHAAAPSVLCVHDRLRPDLQCALVLGTGGTSRLLGTSPCLAEDVADPGAPSEVTVRVADGMATLVEGGRSLSVAMPTLNAPEAHVILPSGFVAVSAVDSQRLWLLEATS